MASKPQKSLFALPAPDLAHVLGHGARELDELRGKQVLITGGSGFFGKWIVGALAFANAEQDLGVRLTVLSRQPEKFLEQYPEAGEVAGLRFQAGDVTDFFETEDRYDYIVHAATDTLGVATHAQEEKRSREIILGTDRMLELARRCGDCRLLVVSSGAIYGAAAGQPAGAREEDDATAQPVTLYAQAKREAEKRCERSGLDFVTARAFAFFGPHLPLEAHYAAGNFLRDARRGGPVIVRGDGTALRTYLHPADLVVWLLRLLLRGGSGRAYNVGSDEAVTTAQLARLIAGAVSPVAEVRIQSLQPQGPQNIYLPNLQRARAELNVSVWIPLAEAVARTMAFLRETT